MMQFSKNIFLEVLVVSLITVATASAQTISIVSGDGQVAPQNFQAGAECPSSASSTLKGCMVVVVKNAQGQPQSGVAVTWTVASGGGSLTQGTTTTTDSN